MRQISIIGAAVGGLVAATLIGSSASAGPAPVAVDGNHFAASGLTLVSQGCSNSRIHPKTEPKFLIKKGPANPPIGDFSIGWDEKGTSYGVGVAAHVVDPTTLKTLGVALNAANGAHGHVVAMFHATGDPGTWRGDANLGSDNTKGWHRVNAAKVSYTWTHFTDGAADGSDSGTLQDLAGRRGGDGEGAEVGFLYGCDGNPFFTDALTVVTGGSNRTYDLGGYRATVKLRTYPGIAKRLHVTYGVKFNLTGKLLQRTTGDGMAGRLTMQVRQLGASVWRGIASKKLAAGGSLKVGVVPPRSVTYRAFYPGTETYEPEGSRLVTLVVSPNIVASFADSSVVKGHAFTLRGRVLPQGHRAIQLQRYLDGQWKTVKKGATRRDGYFGISAVTTRVGKSYWRIRVPGGHGNASGTSPWKKLTTTVPSSGGSTPPTQNDPPPPPADDPPPPPPPTH